MDSMKYWKRNYASRISSNSPLMIIEPHLKLLADVSIETGPARRHSLRLSSVSVITHLPTNKLSNSRTRNSIKFPSSPVHEPPSIHETNNFFSFLSSPCQRMMYDCDITYFFVSQQWCEWKGPTDPLSRKGDYECCGFGPFKASRTSTSPPDISLIKLSHGWATMLFFSGCRH